jgi:hypothetical protein
VTPTDIQRDPARLAQDSARRLGHRWVGAEHLLFALCAADNAPGRVLRAAGLVPAMIWADIRTLSGIGPWAVDRDALAAIGIDLDGVLASVPVVAAGHDLTPPMRRRRLRRRHIPPNAVASRCLIAAADNARGAGPDERGAVLARAVLTSSSHTVTRLLRLANVDLQRLIAALNTP